jgi:hypothetical protein
VNTDGRAAQVWLPAETSSPSPPPTPPAQGNRWETLPLARCLGRQGDSDDEAELHALRGLHDGPGRAPRPRTAAGRYFGARGAAPAEAGEGSHGAFVRRFQAKQAGLGHMEGHLQDYGALPGSVERNRHLCADQSEAEAATWRVRACLSCSPSIPSLCGNQAVATAVGGEATCLAAQGFRSQFRAPVNHTRQPNGGY